MASGTVKKWISDRGFGFIRTSDGSPDIFLHAGDLKKSGIMTDPKEGSKITYDTYEGDRGLRAKNIVMIG